MVPLRARSERLAYVAELRTSCWTLRRIRPFMALKGLQFVSLGPWLSLTGATRLSLDSTSHGDLRALPSPQFGAVKPLWAPDCLRYPLPDTVNDSGGPSGLHASKTSAAG